jgi:hypothetical protein
MERLFRTGLLFAAVLFAFATHASAQVMIYVTDEPGELLYQMNFATGDTTNLWHVDGRPDSLIVYPPTSPSGKIIYTVALSRHLEMFDPTTGTNTLLVNFDSTSPIPGYPRDLVLEPGGTTLLVGLYSPGKIVRYNIVTGTVTLLSKNLGALDGLAYDANGHLFAVSKRSRIVQIDPVTGLILKTLVLFTPNIGTDGADGLTYDSFTGELWAAFDCYTSKPCPVVNGVALGNGLIEVPTDLSTFTEFQSGNIALPDGIVSDGQGNLYIGAGLARVTEYNIPTDTIVKSVKAPGVDDVALIPGTF